MRKSNVDGLTLKDLRFLSDVLNGTGITRAGEVWGLSQPASSRLMDKIRAALGDALLVRSRVGWTRTAFADDLRPRLVEAICSFEGLAIDPLANPLTSRRRFRVATTDYGAMIVVGPLSSLLSTLAPATALDVTAFSSETFDALENGSLDFALYADDKLPDDFHYRDLFTDRYMVLMDVSHPLNHLQVVRSEQIEGYRRVVILYPEGHSLRDDDPSGLVSQVSGMAALRTPFFAAAPLAVVGSDTLLCLPERAALLMRGVSRQLKVARLEPEESFSYRVIWHERYHRDAGFRWLRGRIADAVALPSV